MLLGLHAVVQSKKARRLSPVDSAWSSLCPIAVPFIHCKLRIGISLFQVVARCSMHEAMSSKMETW